ncbi:unnamed protein product [Rotaria magnacalcarata]|uniref:Mono(ADP-ribosyl)transferase n=3 Tax=Rotaria magnacalcarata TaxID=392030 RepID=A0A815R943_9BILA|nr:unnamed protein product [Rotaria magnacalcarata]
MARANTQYDTEEEDDDDDRNDLRYFHIPYVANYGKQFFANFLNSPLLPIEQTIKPLVQLIDNIETKLYIIKQQLNTDSTRNLTLDELGAIHLYTLEESPHTKCIYYLLNQAICRGLPEELQLWYPYLNLLLTALNKLGSIDRHCTVYLGVRSCDLSDEYKEDGIYTWWNFSSCLPSLDQMKLPRFLGAGGVRTVFKIDCYSSKRLPWSDDDEVILMPGFHFQVVGKLRSLDDLNTTYIREKTPSSVEVMSSVRIVKALEAAPQKSPSVAALEIEQQEKPSRKRRPGFKKTAHRIIKMSQVLNGCSDHVLQLSGKKLSFDELKHTLNERLIQEITILNLSKTHLTKEKAKVVGEILRKNVTLTELNLSYNPLGNVGCLRIAQALRDNKHLLTLNLYNTKLSCDAGQYLAEMLSLNHHLRSLHLGVNSLSNVGVKDLLSGNIQLNYLNLSCNRIDQDGCQHLADFLENSQTLIELDFGGNPIGDKGIQILYKSLMSNKTLTDLHVWHCQITNFETICNLIKSNSRLVQLDLEGNQITDEHANALLMATKNNTTLEKLNLSHNKISDKLKTTLQQLATPHLSVILG